MVKINNLNKKGQDLSIGTLILIVLGIVVLVLLILGFSLGWGNLWKKINIFGGTSSVNDIVVACNLAITSNDRFTYCVKTWEIDISGTDTTAYCRHPQVQPNLDGELTCQTSQDDSLFTTLCTAQDGTVEEDPDENFERITIPSITHSEGKVCLKTT